MTTKEPHGRGNRPTLANMFVLALVLIGALMVAHFSHESKLKQQREQAQAQADRELQERQQQKQVAEKAAQELYELQMRTYERICDKKVTSRDKLDSFFAQIRWDDRIKRLTEAIRNNPGKMGALYGKEAIWAAEALSVRFDVMDVNEASFRPGVGKQLSQLSWDEKQIAACIDYQQQKKDLCDPALQKIIDTE